MIYLTIQIIEADIWKYHELDNWVVITTNGELNKKGENIMGKGLALQAKEKFPLLPKMIGDLIKKYGNIPFKFPMWKIITFPTKNTWREEADLLLIEQSCIHLKEITDIHFPIFMPPVGCGCGMRSWTEVKPILDRHLDYCFIVCKLSDL